MATSWNNDWVTLQGGWSQTSFKGWTNWRSGSQVSIHIVLQSATVGDAWWYSSHHVSMSAWTDAGGSASFDMGPQGNGQATTVNNEFDLTLDVGYGAGGTYVRYSASQDGCGSSDVAYISWDATYTTPAAVTAKTTSIISDNRTDLSWTDNATAQASYSGIYLYRSTDGGSMVQIASLAGNATGYSDTTISSNHSYAWTARAYNPAGYADTAVGSAVTTPAPPSGCAAVKTAAATVGVTWTDNSNTESWFEISRTADSGTTWTSLGTVGAGVTSYTDSSAPGGTVAYRVRAARDSSASAWSATSNSVTTICAPAAPTIVSAWGPYSSTGAALRLSWQHNTLDGSAQSKADVYYSLDGGTAWVTSTVSGATSYKDIPITGKAAGVVIKAQVRTYGLYASAGPYSALASTTLAATPQCNITTPTTDGASITDAPLIASWSYTDTFAQAGWTLQLLKGGQLVNAWTGTKETSCSIPLAYLPNAGSYSLTLTVRSGSGFTATASRTFVTAYVAPTVPVVSATFDPVTLSVAVYAFAGAVGTKPATNHMELLRIDSCDGVTDTIVLADPLTAGATVIDRVPRLGQSVTYRVMAAAANGAYSTADAVVDTTTAIKYAWNFGDGDTQVAAMAASPTGKDAPRVERTVLQFAGRVRPVSYYGIHKTNTMTRTGDIWDVADISAFSALASWAGDAIFRDPWGLRIAVACDIDFSTSSGPRTVSISVAMQEVDS